MLGVVVQGGAGRGLPPCIPGTGKAGKGRAGTGGSGSVRALLAAGGGAAFVTRRARRRGGAAGGLGRAVPGPGAAAGGAGLAPRVLARRALAGLQRLLLSVCCQRRAPRLAVR